MKFTITILFILISAFAVNAQDIQGQRLLKALDALEKTEAVVAAQEREITALKRSNDLYVERDVLRLDTIKAKDEEIAALRKMNCDKTIFLFGIIKTVRCK